MFFAGSQKKKPHPAAFIHSFTYSSIKLFIRSFIHPSIHFIHRFIVGKFTADEAIDEHRRLNAEFFIHIFRSSMKTRRRFIDVFSSSQHRDAAHVPLGWNIPWNVGSVEGLRERERYKESAHTRHSRSRFCSFVLLCFVDAFLRLPLLSSSPSLVVVFIICNSSSSSCVLIIPVF